MQIWMPVGETTDAIIYVQKVYGNDEWISLVFDKELEGNHLETPKMIRC